jgi:hypothetical protein
MRVLITVPHGDLYTNDVGVQYIAEELHDILQNKGIQSILLINEQPREIIDMNRPISRRTPWRQELRKHMVGQFAVCDIHGFPGDSASPFARDRCDIALLHTPRFTDIKFLRWYARELARQNLNTGVYPATVPNDIVMEAVSKKARFAFLAEHAEEGYGLRRHHKIYAKAHAKVLLGNLLSE